MSLFVQHTVTNFQIAIYFTSHSEPIWRFGLEMIKAGVIDQSRITREICVT